MVDPKEQQHSKNRIVRIILIISGSISLGLGVIGIIIPILPTTPFLLIAAACYARGSDRFYYWLLNNRCFGGYIQNYREGRGMRLWHKLAVLSLLWVLIGYAALFAVQHVWGKIILFCIAIGVTIHLLKIRTYKP